MCSYILRQTWVVNAALILMETSMLTFILSFLVAVLSAHVTVANSAAQKTPVYGVFVFARLIQLPAIFLTIGKSICLPNFSKYLFDSM